MAESAGFTFLIIGRRGQILRQLTAGRVDARLHVLCRGIDVAVQVELQGDLRGSQRIRRGHLRQAGDLRKLRLERRRDG